MTTDTTPQVTIKRIFSAPRALVYRAFTDPDHFALWWGPNGNFLPREEVAFDVRSGGHMRWHEVFPAEPDIWTNGRIDLTEVVDGELLDGVMRIDGQLPGGYRAFETRMRVEFYDEVDGTTRVEVRQWLPDSHAAATVDGWGEAFSKLEAALQS
jgi:uncharacterized protein YndB with AHSA1/START domain